MNPKVSVVVLTHDSPNHLKRAIESVQAQSYKNTEIIVVYSGVGDDAASKAIAESCGAAVQYYKKTDQGVAAALNFGIKKSTGDYFSWLSHDDVYLPDKLQNQVALTNGKADIIAVADWDLVNRNSRIVRSYGTDSKIEQQPACFLAFAEDSQLNTCAMLFPAALLKAAGLFNESFAAARDYALLNRMIMNGAKLRVTSQPLVHYASHSEDQYETDSKVRANYDFVRSDLIGTLSYDAILTYFDGQDGALRQYHEMLEAGLPRSAAFLMQKIITGCRITAAARDILLNDISALAQGQMATDADSLLSRIVKPSNKKKLLFCSGHWLTGGMERVMSTLFMELQEDYEIFLITPYDERESQISVPGHVTSIKISDERFQMYFDSMILTYALLLDVDVVVGFMNLFERQLNAYQLCVGTKIKTIASNHEYYFYPYKSPVHHKVVKKRLDAYESCGAIVWPNGFNAALCGAYVSNNYVIGNPNNFDISHDPQPGAREKVVIAVGRFNDYVKRVDRILECFALVLQKVPDAKLVLVGKYDKHQPIGPHDKTSINDLLTSLAIPEHSVNFAGEVNTMPDYYAASRVLLLTSNSEGFGMVINEAACFGVPAVCNYIPGIEDIISNGKNGYITDQGDLTTMAARVIAILQDDELSRTMGMNAAKMVAQYDAKHIGDKWRLLVNALTDKQGDAETRKKLQASLGYTVADQQLFASLLARELNEIFYSVTSSGMYVDAGAPFFVVRLMGLPRRLKANIAYEGLPKTAHKIVSRSYRIVRSKVRL